MSDDQLLNFLTARGAIRIDCMRDVLAQLAPGSGPSPDSLAGYRAARGLDMLGHAEYHARSRPAKLFVAPACLARLPVVERCLYILCGARGAGALDELAKISADHRIRVQITQSRHPQSHFMPTKIGFVFQDESDAQQLAAASSIHISPAAAAWGLACLAYSMKDFESSLQWRSRSISPAQLRFYSPSRMLFEEASGGDDAGLAQTVGSSPSYYIVEREREAPVLDLDYARYWSHSKQGVACVQHDLRRRLLAVPERLPLPRLFARSLCLCTGQIPGRSDGRFLRTKRASHIFAGIPEEIASKIADKLGIHFIPQPIAHVED